MDFIELAAEGPITLGECDAPGWAMTCASADPGRVSALRHDVPEVSFISALEASGYGSSGSRRQSGGRGGLLRLRDIGMAMDELPVAAFEAKYLGDS
jgi:hypothetical protein